MRRAVTRARKKGANMPMTETEFEAAIAQSQVNHALFLAWWETHREELLKKHFVIPETTIIKRYWLQFLEGNAG